MSSFIPMVSSSPPPMDNDEGWGDDDGFGDFATVTPIGHQNGDGFDDFASFEQHTSANVGYSSFEPMKTEDSKHGVDVGSVESGRMDDPAISDWADWNAYGGMEGSVQPAEDAHTDVPSSLSEDCDNSVPSPTNEVVVRTPGGPLEADGPAGGCDAEQGIGDSTSGMGEDTSQQSSRDSGLFSSEVSPSPTGTGNTVGTSSGDSAAAGRVTSSGNSAGDPVTSETSQGKTDDFISNNVSSFSVTSHSDSAISTCSDQDPGNNIRDNVKDTESIDVDTERTMVNPEDSTFHSRSSDPISSQCPDTSDTVEAAQSRDSSPAPLDFKPVSVSEEDSQSLDGHYGQFADCSAGEAAAVFTEAEASAGSDSDVIRDDSTPHFSSSQCELSDMGIKSDCDCKQPADIDAVCGGGGGVDSCSDSPSHGVTLSSAEESESVQNGSDCAAFVKEDSKPAGSDTVGHSERGSAKELGDSPEVGQVVTDTAGSEPSQESISEDNGEGNQKQYDGTSAVQGNSDVHSEHDSMGAGQTDGFTDFASNGFKEAEATTGEEKLHESGDDDWSAFDTGHATTASRDNWGEGTAEEDGGGWAAFGSPSGTAGAAEGGDWAAFSGRDVTEPVSLEPDDDWDAFADVTTPSADTQPVSGDLESRQEDNFGDFETHDNVPKLQQVPKGKSLGGVLLECFPAHSTDLNGNLGGDPALLGVTVEVKDSHQQEVISKVAGRHRETKSVISIDKNVWNNLKDMENTVALKYQWSQSQSSQALLRAINVDTRNMLVGHKKPVVPIFAAGLGVLEPTRVSDPVSALTGTAPVMVEPTGAPAPGNTQQEIPPVDFNWSDSGLTNPLDAVEKEREILQALEADGSDVTRAPPPSQPLQNLLAGLGGRKSPARAPLSDDARRFLARLPDLSFMGATVLMFPLKGGDVTEQAGES